MERILEQKIGDLSAKKVNQVHFSLVLRTSSLDFHHTPFSSLVSSSFSCPQIVALIIRKHLSWLIVWGNLSGALIGLVAELATILAAKFSGGF